MYWTSHTYFVCVFSISFTYIIHYITGYLQFFTMFKSVVFNRYNDNIFNLHTYYLCRWLLHVFISWIYYILFFSQSEMIWIISLSAALKMYKNCSNLDNFLNWLDIALFFLMATSCNCLKMGCSHINKIWSSSPIPFSQYGQILKFLGVFGLEYLPLSIGRLWSDNLNLAMYLLSEVKFKYVSNFRLLFTLAKNYNFVSGLLLKFDIFSSKYLVYSPQRFFFKLWG